MNTNKNPKWWTDAEETSWNRVKLAVKRDWDQTKHDLGGGEPDTHQTAGDTLKQAGGTKTIPPRGEPTYEEFEAAHRFGYGARSNYGGKYHKWDDELERHLKQDWEEVAPNRKQTWMQDRAAIRYGWDYDT